MADQTATQTKQTEKAEASPEKESSESGSAPSGKQQAAGPKVRLGRAGTRSARPAADGGESAGAAADGAPPRPGSTPPLRRTAPSAAAGERGREAARLFALAADMHRQGRLEEAVRGYSRALSFDPGMADAYNNLGVALRTLGRSTAAVAAYRRSLALRSDNPGVLSNMGNALRDLGRLEEAREAHQQAVRAVPDSAEALYNLGLVLRDLGHVRDALDCFDRAAAMKPRYVDCRWDRALTLLQLGDLPRGFVEYEWRWALEEAPRRRFEQPAWDGGDLTGRTILVHQEEGPGDMIQFARYLPLLADRAEAVIVECQPELARLLASVPGVAKVVMRGRPLPAFDVYVPMLSLARLFGTTLETIPADVPYLAPPEMHGLHLPAPAGHLKVGISWAGRPGRREARSRSLDVEPFVDLMGTPDTAFYSLQQGEAAAALAGKACDGLVTDMGPKLEDLADAAAVVAQLDLVITADTALAHLAGALGVPTWVLVPFAPDWRWLRDRDDSPWYPSVRLFRQPAPGDWDGVFVRLREALAEAARNRPPAGSAR